MFKEERRKWKRPTDLSSVTPAVLQFANSSPYEHKKKKKINSPCCQMFFSFTFRNACINTVQLHPGCFKTWLFSYLCDMKWSLVELPSHCTGQTHPSRPSVGLPYLCQMSKLLLQGRFWNGWGTSISNPAWSLQVLKCPLVMNYLTADEVAGSLFALFYLPAAPSPWAVLALCSVVSCRLYHMQIQVILGDRLKFEVSQPDSLSPTYLVQGWHNNPSSFWKP